MKKRMFFLFMCTVLFYMNNVFMYSNIFKFENISYDEFVIEEVIVNDIKDGEIVLNLNDYQSGEISSYIFENKYKKIKDKGFRNYDRLYALRVKGTENGEAFWGTFMISNVSKNGVEFNYYVKGYKGKSSGKYQVIGGTEELYKKICVILT